jgi:hypothetical protein
MKANCRIELRIDDRDVEPINGIDRLPVGQRRAAERIDAKLQTGGANGVHVHDVPQVVDVGQNEIFLMRGAALIAAR